MSYREQAPPPGLVPWHACTWERRSDGGPPVRVVPDGCVDVVWTEGAGTQIVGANTTAFFVPLAAGVRVVGARLRPGAAPALLGIVGEEVRDARLPVEEVWASEDERRVLRLGRALEAARAGHDLARVALDGCYADQAHFANDCRSLAGAPPSVVLAT